MKNQQEIISDLKELVSIVNDGKEGYQEAAEQVKSSELKTVFMELSLQRETYENELKAHILTHGGESNNDSGGVLGALHRTWIDIRETFASNEDSAILDSVITGEKAAIEKYNDALKDFEDHEDHYQLLANQREGIRSALSKIETLYMQYQD